MRLHRFSARFFYHIRELGLFFRHYSHTYKISLASQRDRKIDEVYFKIRIFLLGWEWKILSEQENFWLDTFSIPFSLKNNLKQWRCNGRYPVFRPKKCAYNMVYQVAPDTSLQDMTWSSYSYSRSTKKPCPACHLCTTTGHTPGYPQGQSAHNSSQDMRKANPPHRLRLIWSPKWRLWASWCPGWSLWGW